MCFPLLNVEGKNAVRQMELEGDNHRSGRSHPARIT